MVVGEGGLVISARAASVAVAVGKGEEGDVARGSPGVDSWSPRGGAPAVPERRPDIPHCLLSEGSTVRTRTKYSV